jgi:protein arginine kinase
VTPFFSHPVAHLMPWLDSTGPASEIVISTRGRLARNLSAYDFPHHSQPAARKSARDELQAALRTEPGFSEGWSLDLAHLEKNQLALLREKHLVGSQEPSEDHYRTLLISQDGSGTALINGEDHLRLHAYQSGFQPQGVLSQIQEYEKSIESGLDFAFHDDFGYLTASPANAGTALRISVLVHLPGLVMGGEIQKILNALRQLRFGVRGIFGNGGSVRGAIFQISNLVTMGRDELEVVGDFEFHIGKVLRHERIARQQLFAKDSIGLEDLSQRSLAILQNSILMTAQEGIDRLNHLRLGVGLGMLPGLDVVRLNEAMIRMQTAHLVEEAGHPLTVPQKSEARATLFRSLFSGV